MKGYFHKLLYAQKINASNNLLYLKVALTILNYRTFNSLKSLREDDVLIVWKLERLGRSLQHLIDVVNDLEERKIGFQSITENIDTTSPTGKLIFHIFGSLAEFERGLIRERVKAGLEAAKKRGKKFGRPDALDDKAKEMAFAMFNGGALKIDIARHFNVTRQTVYSLLKEVEV